ncbi:MAG: AMP-binding protein [Acidobacteriota bacterium]|nr:AMP-binding protein [Acidobacteriota bacterium]
MPKSNNNLRQLLENQVLANSEKTFLFSEIDGREWTYSEFDKAVNRTANLLVANDIKKGDVVSLLLPNSAEYIIAYFACFKIGAIAGPVNSLLKSDEMEWIAGNSEAKLILIGSQFQHGSVPSAVAGGLTKYSEFRVQSFESESLPNSALIPLAGGSDALLKIIVFDSEAETTKELSETLEEVDINSDDGAIIIYTSGTTGKPKGCLLTHGNLFANARQITEWLGFNENDRLLTIMPLFHMNAVSVTTMTALYAGASTVVSPKFSASRFWDIVAKYEITSFGSVATMLSMLLANSNQCSSISGRPDDTSHATHNPRLTTHLRFAMCGSAPVPAEVLRKFEETFNCLVIEGYGLSESTCRSTFNPPNETRRPGSCGQPIGNEMKIFDDNDAELPDGELGEIVLRGDNIFKKYYKNPDATAKAFTNGWFHTGDIGYRDTEGFFYIADRKSDMIIRGGENIYPREIDDLLYTHPAIESAAVIGVPNELYGEEVAAFVVLKKGFSSPPSDHSVRETRPPLLRQEGSQVDAASADGLVVTEAELIDFCRMHLADFKCPKTIRFVPDIPKGPTGKLLKRELTRLFAMPEAERA